MSYNHFSTRQSDRKEYRSLQRWFDWDNLANWKDDDDWEGSLEEYGPWQKDRCSVIGERELGRFKDWPHKFRLRYHAIKYKYHTRCPGCGHYYGDNDD
jgi:hypothetical protein